MPNVTLRFYGRWVVAEPVNDGQPAGTVSFLAPNMTTSPNPARRFNEHHVLLTVPRTSLNRARTTIEPSSRTMSDVRAGFAELRVWRLERFNITLDGKGPFTLEQERDTTLVELTEPVPSVKYSRQIDTSGLAATSGGLTVAAIHLNTGRAQAFASFKSNYNFVTESDASDGDPVNDQLLGTDGQLADVIEVVVGADAESLVRLRVQALDGAGGEICIDTKHFKPTVSFTNLCPALPRDFLYDLEFARYYDYIRSGPQNAPIPAVVPSAGAMGDCDQSAHFYYEPS